MRKVLKFINAEMKKAGVEYYFQKNKKPKPIYPYFVGELVPAEPVSEDGEKEFTLGCTVIRKYSQQHIINADKQGAYR